MSIEKLIEMEKLENKKQRNFYVPMIDKEITICQKYFEKEVMKKYFTLVKTSLEYINMYIVDITNLELPRFIIYPNKFETDNGVMVDGLFRNIIDGEYKVLDVIISTYLDKGTIFQIIVHELGHWLHYSLFNDKYIRWYREELNEQALINNREAFAEIFINIFNDVDNKNTRKMRRLFDKINEATGSED